MDAFDTSVSRALKLGVADGTFEQIKQSFRLSRSQRPKLKAIVEGTAPRTRKPSRPLKKWTIEALKEEKNDLKFEEVRDAIAKEHKIAGDFEKFERALKAVLTRGVKDDVFVTQGADDAATFGLSGAEKERQAEKQRKKEEKEQQKKARAEEKAKKKAEEEKEKKANS